MPNLVVCCDGTWNTPDQEDNGRPAPTNVFKLHGSIEEFDSNGTEQERYYREGVGTTGGWWRRIRGGALGLGLSDDIKSAYKWLCEKYVSADDKIFLFGFSRGAYTARSLAGLIGRSGLLIFPENFSESEKWQKIEEVFQKYRSGRSTGGVPADSHRAEIHFLGVWDTVGALGIPDELFLNAFDRPRKYQFHDTELGSIVKCARHAVAIDERRQTFAPTLWTGNQAGRDIDQKWFAGVHGDVGGSYADNGLGDTALQWMIDEAMAKGLVFNKNSLVQVRPDPSGILHDSVKGLYARLRTRPRSVPRIPDGQNVDGSVLSRTQSPPISQPIYWPTDTLQVGDTREVDVFAKEHWNRTGIFLESDGSYEFSATGEWLDRSIRCTPDGPEPGFQWGKLFQSASVISDGLQRYYRNKRGLSGAIVRGARREQDMPWYCLVGVIGNGVGVDSSTQRLNQHEAFKIGSAARHNPKNSGYLYCFANDVWSFYGNNKGSLRLSVSRVK